MRFLRVALGFETFSSKQDQVALYLGLGRGAEESVGAIPGFRGGYHACVLSAFSHLWSRFGPLLLILI
jgi:hypothetical protein